MATIKLKRSSVAGKIPTIGQLEYGELAVNTVDGKIYLKRSGSVGDEIFPVMIIGARNSGSVQITGSFSVSNDINATTVSASSLMYSPLMQIGFDSRSLANSQLVISNQGSTSVGVKYYNYSISPTNGPKLYFYRSEGNPNNESAIDSSLQGANGYILGEFRFNAYAFFSNASAKILISSTGSFNSGSFVVPSKMVFSTAQEGGIGVTDAMEIDQNQLVTTHHGLYTEKLSFISSTTGRYVDNISTDITLSGSSDNTLPTENVVKTYVDTVTTPLVSTASVHESRLYSIEAATSSLQDSASIWNQSGTTVTLNSSANIVGINNNSPTYNLDISGSFKLSEHYRYTNYTYNSESVYQGAGWYRLGYLANNGSAKFKLSTQGNNTFSLINFDVMAGSFGTGNSVLVYPAMRYGNSPIQKLRVGGSGSAAIYVDIYIDSTLKNDIFVAVEDRGNAVRQLSYVELFSFNPFVPTQDVVTVDVLGTRNSHKLMLHSSETAGGGFIGGRGSTSHAVYSFSGSEDTGLYSPTLDHIGTLTAGTQRTNVSSYGLTVTGSMGVSETGSFSRLRVDSTSSLSNLYIGDSASSPITYPLTFHPSVGGKISLYAAGADIYGIGVQGNQLEMFTPNTAKISFGKGQSGNITSENLTVDNANSRVGVLASSPTKTLDVGGDVKIGTSAQQTSFHEMTGSLYISSRNSSEQFSGITQAAIKLHNNIFSESTTGYTLIDHDSDGQTNIINTRNDSAGKIRFIVRQVDGSYVIPLVLYRGGKIGINWTGSLSPTSLMHVSASTSVPGINIDSVGNKRHISLGMDTSNVKILFNSGSSFVIGSQPHADRSSTSTNVTNRIVVKGNNGNVGIGTNSPATALQVVGEVSASNARFAAAVGIGAQEAAGGTYRLDIVETGNVKARIKTTSGNQAALVFSDAASTGETWQIGCHGGNNAFKLSMNETFDNPVITVLSGSGYVGINNSSPSYNLDLTGTLRVTSYSYLAAAAIGTTSSPGANALWVNGDLAITFGNRIIMDKGSGNSNLIHSASHLSLRAATTPIVSIDSAGDGSLYLGKGNGSYNDGEIYIDGTSGNVQINSSMYISSSGNVGIGTDSPRAKLHIYSQTSGSSVFLVEGQFGELFQIFDEVSGSLLSISDVSGLPVFEVFDDDRVVMGSFGANTLVVTGSRVGIGTATPTVALDIVGSITASGDIGAVGNIYGAAKLFDIQHPLDPSKRLRHGSLEGPEHSVYVRGRIKNDNFIKLPDYWEKLVDPDSVTVQLTPIGLHQELYVVYADNKEVTIANNSYNKIDCYYFIQAERIDIPKLKVE